MADAGRWGGRASLSDTPPGLISSSSGRLHSWLCAEKRRSVLGDLQCQAALRSREYGQLDRWDSQSHVQATNRQLTNSAHRIIETVVLRINQPAKSSFFLASSPRTTKIGNAASTYRGIPISGLSGVP